MRSVAARSRFEPAPFEAWFQRDTQDKPRCEGFSVSAEGMLEASKWAKDFAGNIGSTITKLGKSIWPDFDMPK